MTKYRINLFKSYGQDIHCLVAGAKNSEVTLQKIVEQVDLNGLTNAFHLMCKKFRGIFGPH